MISLDIYTDGSCIGNPGPGGWAYCLLLDNMSHVVSGNKENTTNNVMELTAFLESIKRIDKIKRRVEVNIYIDSQYVINGCTKWQEGWVKREFKTANKSPVKNQELWREILPLYNKLNEKHRLNLYWVKAHTGNKYNEVVDSAAYNEASKIKGK